MKIDEYTREDESRIVCESGLFDPDYYKNQIRIDWTGIDPVEHFLDNWRINLASASAAFNVCRYLGAYPDVPKSGLNPLVHYITTGREEKRRIFGDQEPFDKQQIFTELSFHEARYQHIKYSYKRAAVFAAYNKNFVIEPYVIYFLEELKEICDIIIFVADNYFPFNELLKIRHLVDIFECSWHGERDFGSYKRGISLANQYNILHHVNDLIICNDSFYGPLFELYKLYETMDARNVDFWGISHSFVRKEHIQSYFFNFNRKVFLSHHFNDFFNKVKRESDVNAVIINYEVELTDYLARRGFTYSAYQDMREIFYENGVIPNYNSSQYVCKIIEHGAPFVKRKALSNPFADNRDGLIRTFEMLRKHSPALANLMWQDYLDLYPSLQCGASFSVIHIADDPDSILDTINAIISQTLADYELVIVAPQGQENLSQLIFHQYQSLINSAQIKLVTAPDEAPRGTLLNLALHHTSHEWIYVTTPGGLPDPEMLEYFALSIHKEPEARIHYCQYRVEHGSQVKHGKKYEQSEGPYVTLPPPGTMLINRRYLQESGGFDKDLDTLADRELLNRVLFEGNSCFTECPLVTLMPSIGEENDEGLETLQRQRAYLTGSLPKITTIITSFQHEATIAQAIESALMQSGDFYHEIIIADDGSSDVTAEIVNAYHRQYPYIIKNLSSAENMGRISQMQRLLANVRCDYLCFLEGDDQWLAAEKLSSQMFYLQAHKNCQLCFSGVSLFDEQTGISREPDNQSNLATLLEGEDILSLNNPVITLSSIMVRGPVVGALSWEALEAINDDLGMALYCANFGPLGFIPEVQTLYRISPTGAWSGLTEREKIEDKIARREKLKRYCHRELVFAINDDIRRLKSELASLRRAA